MLERFFINSVRADERLAKDLNDAYLYDVISTKYLLDGNVIRFNNPVTFLVGENGTGKSTLLEAIAIDYGFNAEGGTRNFNFSTNNSCSDFYKCLRLGKELPYADGYFLRAESFYNVASYIDDADKIAAAAPPIISSYGGVSMHNQSHGESFLALIKNRFHGNGLYILDEPEAALSPMRLLTLLAEMNYLVQKDAQFIISTHSPILMAFPGARILEIYDNGIRETTYKETEHYQITKSFIENPDRIFKHLFA